MPQAEGLAKAEAELRDALAGVLALGADSAALDLRLQDADEQISGPFVQR